MRLVIEDRVEQALRHLQPTEAKKVSRLLGLLEAKTFEDLRSQFQIHPLSIPGEKVFVLKATPVLRILLKYGEDQTLLIEDIVSHGVLENFFSGRHK